MASRRHEIVLETKKKVSHMMENLSLSTAVKIFSLRSILNFPSDLAYYSAVLSLCVLECDLGRCFDTLQSTCGSSSLSLCAQDCLQGWSLNNIKVPGVVNN